MNATNANDPNSSGDISCVSKDRLEFLTTEQMIEVDRLMTDVLKIELMQMMENAGRNLARLAIKRFLDDSRFNRVVVMAGTGGNGGGAMVAARRLHQWGTDVSVLTTKPDEKYSGVPGHQLAILRRLGIDVNDSSLPSLPTTDGNLPDLILDGVIGYSLKGDPRGRAADLISWANSSAAPILALDVPSGLDSTSGIPRDPAVVAVATMTLAMPKAGLSSSEAKSMIGELFVADIGVPSWVYREIGIQRELGNLFRRVDILKVESN